MKKSDAQPGTKVLASYSGAYEEYGDEEVIAYRYDGEGEDYGTLVGVIRTKKASPGHVWVKWIEGDYREQLDEETEVDLNLLILESERSAIEQEFKNVSKEIKAKMKEAADLVNEAGKLAKKAHAELQSMYDACRPLINAMDNNGWRSSSWGC